MKKIFFYLFVFSALIFKSQKVIGSQTLPDSIIQIEQNKVIGGIMFGMSEKEAQKEIKKFEKAQGRVGYLGLTYITIGEYQAEFISDSYYEDKLYYIKIEGMLLNYEYIANTIPEQIKYITEIIENKYGKPIINNVFESTDKLVSGKEYLLNSWVIGKKSIEISLEANDSYCQINVYIYLPEIIDKIKAVNELEKQNREKESKEKDKDLF